MYYFDNVKIILNRECWKNVQKIFILKYFNNLYSLLVDPSLSFEPSLLRYIVQMAVIYDSSMTFEHSWRCWSCTAAALSSKEISTSTSISNPMPEQEGWTPSSEVSVCGRWSMDLHIVPVTRSMPSWFGRISRNWSPLWFIRPSSRITHSSSQNFQSWNRILCHTAPL